MKPDVVALITARGGSKRLPRKNILPVGGKPLIAWSIEAALKAPSVRRLIVSTDDPEIAATARAFGAEVPFLRPAELSGDRSAHIDVLVHALNRLRDAGDLPEYLLLLQPTSPLRTAGDIEGIIALAYERDAGSVVSVRPAADHPLLCRKLDKDGRLIPFVPVPDSYVRTQDMPAAYAINGALYLMRAAGILAGAPIIGQETIAYVMPPERSLDVDSAWDLRLVGLVLSGRYP